MGTFALRENTVVHIDKCEYRLIRKVTESLWQLEESKTRFIRQFETEELLRLLVDARLTFPATVPARIAHEATCDLADKVTEIAKIRRTYVRAALEVPNTRQKLESVIDDIWSRIKLPATKPGYVTLYRWKRRYLQSGGDYRGLIDNTNRKGNRTDRFPAEVMSMCKDAIAERYMRRERSTIQSTFEHALLKVRNENRLRPTNDSLPFPTRRLITRLVSEIPAFDKYSARYGFNAAQRTFRSVKGHVVTDRPLKRAEIDHTQLDLLVVDDHSFLPMGRPWITACIDDYSRCILGIYVGFVPPSAVSVTRCLKDCFLPKTKLKEEFPGITNDWPSYGVMQELVVDNGLEFHAKNLENACYSLGIDLTYSPRKQAWFKGKIERFLGTINRDVTDGLPGTTFRNIIEKSDYDPTRHACIRLSTIKWAIRKWVADVYHQKMHSALSTSPAAMWASSIKQEDITFPDDLSQLDAVFGKVERRVLTHKGIEYAGLFYNSDELETLTRREGTNLNVEIRVDEEDIGALYVLWPKSSELFRVPARKPDYANGLSLWQHNVIRRNQQTDRPSDDQGPLGWLTAKACIQEEIARDFGLKRTRTRKRVARYQEASGQAIAKAGNRGVTSPSLDSIQTAQRRSPEPIAGYAEVPRASMAQTVNSHPDDDRPRYKAIYKKEDSND